VIRRENERSCALIPMAPETVVSTIGCERLATPEFTALAAAVRTFSKDSSQNDCFERFDKVAGVFFLPSPGGGGSIAVTTRSFVTAIGVG
jgi:hypothetical protein